MNDEGNPRHSILLNLVAYTAACPYHLLDE